MIIVKRTLHPHAVSPSYNIAKICFAWERTEKATVITKKRDYHRIKNRTLAVQRCFYFFDTTYMKKSFSSLKNTK